MRQVKLETNKKLKSSDPPAPRPLRRQASKEAKRPGPDEQLALEGSSRSSGEEGPENGKRKKKERGRKQEEGSEQKSTGRKGVTGGEKKGKKK
jgi:hypothetical protein